MMRAVGISTLLMTSAFGGCAAVQPMIPPAPPPPLPVGASNIASWLNAQNVMCREVQPPVSATPASASDARVRPTYVRRCSTRYPYHMLSREVEAACYVKFSLNDAGVPVSPSKACNVRGASSQEASSLEAMYLGLAERVVMSQRFAPIQDERPNANRTNLIQPIRFVIADEGGPWLPYPVQLASALPNQPPPLILN